MARPVETPDSAQMRAAARMYYKEHVTKQTIAEKLHIDPRKVTWLLDQAKHLGIVRIYIHETPEEELAGPLQRKYPHLERVLIAPGPKIEEPEQCEDLFQRFGALAEDYFEELVEHHPRGKELHIGVGGGQRLLAFANAVQQRNREDVYVHVTALIGRGRLKQSAIHIDPIVPASILWSRCGGLPGHIEYATVSPYDPTAGRGLQIISDEFEKVQKNQTVKNVIEAMNNLDLVIAGIGSPRLPDAFENRMTMTPLLQGIVPPNVFREMVGDFSYCPYDAQGNTRPEWRLFMTAGHYAKYWGVEFYKRMVVDKKKVVAFGGHPSLLPAIKAALIGKMINVLIIDEYSARQLAEVS